MKKILSVLIVICMISSMHMNPVVFAEAEIYIESVNKTGNVMTVSGRISGNTKKEVTILVRDGEKIVYIDQETSDDTGNYTFTFGLPENSNNCTYTIMQGGTSVDVPAIMQYEDSVSADKSEIYIESVNKTGNIMTVSGRISGNTKKEVTILVRDGEKIVYIDQETSDDTGNYTFTFGLPENSNNCIYTIMQGGTSVDVPAVMQYEDSSQPITKEKCILTANARINLSATQVNLSGIVNVTRGTTVDIELQNITDNTSILSQHIAWIDGECPFDVTIPNIHQTKKYKANVIMRSAVTGNEIGKLELADIDTSLLTIDVNGRAFVENGYYITGNLKSVNTGLLDKSTIFESEKNFDFSIPNAVVSTYDLDVKCYDKAAAVNDIITVSREYNNVLQNQTIDIFTNGIGVADIGSKIFSIEYSASEAELADGCLFTKADEITIGAVKGTDIEIINLQPGRIDYRMNGVYTNEPSDLTINGIRLKSLINGNIKIYFTMEDIANE